MSFDYLHHQGQQQLLWAGDRLHSARRRRRARRPLWWGIQRGSRARPPSPRGFTRAGQAQLVLLTTLSPLPSHPLTLSAPAPLTPRTCMCAPHACASTCSPTPSPQVWLYLIFPTLAGVLAGLFFHVTSPDDYGHVSRRRLLRELPAYAMEFVTTFFLSMFVALSPLFGASKFTELAMFALTVALLSMAGSTSGCHMNPAVSIGLYVRSARLALPGPSNSQSFTHYSQVRSRWSPIAEGFPARKLALYVLAQLMGAICAAFVAIGLLLHLPTVGVTVMTDTEIDTEIGFPFPAAGAGKAFLAEVIGTTAVVYVMLNVATVRHLARNSFFGNQPGLLCD